MPRKNNVIPDNHFRKDWQRYVKTWFNQPARKVRRRNARAEKAARIFPRPVAGALRPAVRGQTVRYNSKVRLGRGFTLDELKAAKVNKHEAQSLGISVDHRRKNRSENTFSVNVQRLKEYKSKLIVFPRNAKKPTKADSSAEEQKKADQLKSGVVLPIKKKHARLEVLKLKDVDTKASAYTTLRNARNEARLVGVRKVRKAKKEQEAALEAQKSKG